MTKPLVLVIGRFDNQALLKARQHPQIEFVPLDQFNPQWPQNERVEGLIIRSTTKVDVRLLEMLPRLKVILTATAGFDHIDLAAVGDRVKVGYLPLPPVQSVVELVLLLTLSALRKQRVVQLQLAQGNWERETLTGSLLSGKTLGIVGCGRIGSQVAALGHHLGATLIGYDPYLESIPPFIEMVGYEELLRMSNVISFHVPQTKKTRHMLNKSTLQAVNTDVVIVNTSRGGVIDEAQLVRFLQSKPLAAAALDVFENEPLHRDSPLYSLPNVVFTPHIGATTRECLSQSSFQAMSNIEKFFTNETLDYPLPPASRWWDEAR